MAGDEVVDRQVAEVPNATPLEYTNEDLQKQSFREIANETPTEEGAQPTEDDQKAAIEARQEELRAVADETAKRVVEELKPQETVIEEPPEPTDKEKEYLAWEAQFKVAHEGNPPTYVEALEFVKGQSKDEIKRELKAEAEEAEKESIRVQAEKQRLQDEENKSINAYVDDELKDLYKAGKLTPIQDPNNPSDQGVVERKELFRVWGEVNNQRRAQNLPEIVSATRVFEFYYAKPNAQPAGAEAPIAGNRGSATPPGDTPTYSYQDLKRPWSFFKRGQGS